MGDQKKKDYDPTMLRAVGNILAGSDILTTGGSHIRQGIIERAVSIVLDAKKELKKQSPVED